MSHLYAACLRPRPMGVSGFSFFLPAKTQGVTIYNKSTGFQEGPMQPSKSGVDTGTARTIERQMLLAGARDRASRATAAGQSSLQYRFITLSRDAGSQGDEIAQILGQRLNWMVCDKEILDCLAQNRHVRQGLVEQLDEKAQNLVHETIQRFLRMAEGGSFGITEYYEALLKALAFLTVRGDAILIGRGANFVLRAESAGLHIRIIASPATRIERLSVRWRIPPAEARWRMEELDAQRRSFIRHHFKQIIDDPGFYDLVYDTDHLTPEQVVESIIGVMQSARPQGAAKPFPSGIAATSTLGVRSA
jgi:cytidylate kinase